MRKALALLLALASAAPTGALAGPTVKRSSWVTLSGYSQVALNRWTRAGRTEIEFRNFSPPQCPPGNSLYLLSIQATPVEAAVNFGGNILTAADPVRRLDAWKLSWAPRQGFGTTVNAWGKGASNAEFRVDAGLPTGAVAEAGPVRLEVWNAPADIVSVAFEITMTAACGPDENP
jgi:hypothetical protein